MLLHTQPKQSEISIFGNEMVDKKPSEREEDWSDPSISPLHLGRKLAWGEELKS